MGHAARTSVKSEIQAPAPSALLTMDGLTTQIMGFGPIERNAEFLASGIRVGLPGAFLDPEFGFPEVLVGAEWIMMYRDVDYLIATPMHVWPEFLELLHQKLCTEIGLSDQSFFNLHVNRAHRVRTDKRYRWNIHEALAKEMHHESTTCPLVFQTFGPTIEIRTRGRFLKELRSAEAEAEELRQKGAALKRPGIAHGDKSEPKGFRLAKSKHMKS